MWPRRQSGHHPPGCLLIGFVERTLGKFGNPERSGSVVAFPVFVTFICTFAVNCAAAKAFLRVSGQAHRDRGFLRGRPQPRQVVHMKTFSGNRVSRLFALLAALALALAQGGAQAQPAYVFSQQELDQMLAPIALYPDALLSQILMASTYPLEVVEAARWSNARPGLTGDDAVRAAGGESWDPSVKSLVAFPQVLERMDEYPQWTQALGDAFLDQQAQVMDTVQNLRRRAEAAGNLRSDDRVRVVDSGSGLMVEQFNPELVYVPYYDPLVVYGSWWWPAYPPVHWRPWSGYYARPGYARGFYWGPPVGISAGFFFGAFDWPRREVRVVRVNNYYYRHSVAVNRAVIANRAPGAWQHEPEHRRGIAYLGHEAQRRFGAVSAQQGQGNRAGPADPRRWDQRMDVRSAAPPAIRPDARSDGRRPDVRPAAEMRANAPPAAQPAPVMQSAPADTRFDSRRDSRSIVQPAPADTRFDRRRESRANVPPAAQSARVTQPTPPDTRFDRGRDTRNTAQPAPSAPVMQAAPVMRPAPVMQAVPVMRPAPVVHPAPVMQAAPAVHPAPVSSGNRQAEPHEPGARREPR
jgi:hypothetical protein